MNKCCQLLHEDAGETNNKSTSCYVGMNFKKRTDTYILYLYVYGEAWNWYKSLKGKRRGIISGIVSWNMLDVVRIPTEACIPLYIVRLGDT